MAIPFWQPLYAHGKIVLTAVISLYALDYIMEMSDTWPPLYVHGNDRYMTSYNVLTATIIWHVILFRPRPLYTHVTTIIWHVIPQLLYTYVATIIWHVITFWPWPLYDMLYRLGRDRYIHMLRPLYDILYRLGRDRYLHIL